MPNVPKLGDFNQDDPDQAKQGSLGKDCPGPLQKPDDAGIKKDLQKQHVHIDQPASIQKSEKRGPMKVDLRTLRQVKGIESPQGYGKQEKAEQELDLGMYKTLPDQGPEYQGQQSADDMMGQRSNTPYHRELRTADSYHDQGQIPRSERFTNVFRHNMGEYSPAREMQQGGKVKEFGVMQ